MQRASGRPYSIDDKRISDYKATFSLSSDFGDEFLCFPIFLIIEGIAHLIIPLLKIVAGHLYKEGVAGEAISIKSFNFQIFF